MKKFLNIFLELEFDRRCRRFTAVIGALAAVLILTACVCRACEGMPIAIRQLLALTGSLSACGMLTLYAMMTAEALAKRIPEKAEPIYRIADSISLAAKLFFLLASCGNGLAVACAALMIDAVLSRGTVRGLRPRTPTVGGSAPEPLLRGARRP